MNMNVQKQLWFSHIYQSHQTVLLSWFKQKLQLHHQSEDLSHEVFYRALKSDYHYESIKEPKAWLFGIAKHVIIDHWRHQQVERLYLEALVHLPAEFHPSVEHEICIRETLNQVHKVLESLPSRASQVFLLSQLDGLTYKAISEQLHISEATVKRDMKLAFLACINIYHNSN